MKIIPIENETSYVKDEHSGAILNVDQNMLADRLNRKRSKEKIQKLEKEVECLKQEISSIKKFLNLG
jgi:tetrahydromethanopterin S-methyltransferase subunit B